MTIPYFFIGKENITDNRINLTGNDFRHLVKVLRARKGDPVDFSDNSGTRYSGNIETAGSDFVDISITKETKTMKRLPEIIVFQCILKKEAMEFSVQKSAEIGADYLVPVMSKRVLEEYNKDKLSVKINRWRLIALNASMQCKRDYIFEIRDHINLESINMKEFDLFILPDENYPTCNIGSLRDMLSIDGTGRPTPYKPKRIAFIAGPEGGFEKKEIELLSERGAARINFGKNILRAETATLYLLSVIDFLLKL
jgi:16S rRNA (uracil1498-N3)-methyltransferase